jgi:cathepsin L
LLSEAQYQNAFVNFMQTHQKSYQHDEFQARYQIFKDNHKFIEEHNAGDHSFTVAINQFADMTSEEFASIYNGVKYTHVEREIAMPEELAGFEVSALPHHVDWRTKGAVTAVKNQGQCGSCWSFSTTGSVEGQHFLFHQQTPPGNGGALVGLSEQNLMDCSVSYGNNGCGGGLMDDAFRYIIANGGIDTEASYPYTAQDQPTCQYTQANLGACIEQFKDIPQGNEQALQVASANVGPISVAIDAGNQSFQFYSGGVYYEPACSPTALDHGVLVVGYGVDNGQKYWLVKNSWSASWGLNGYIMMSRDRNNNCGIASAASYPVITKTQC